MPNFEDRRTAAALRVQCSRYLVDILAPNSIYYTILIMCYTILYYTILIMYYTILYCTILYYYWTLWEVRLRLSFPQFKKIATRAKGA